MSAIRDDRDGRRTLVEPVAVYDVAALFGQALHKMDLVQRGRVLLRAAELHQSWCGVRDAITARHPRELTADGTLACSPAVLRVDAYRVRPAPFATPTYQYRSQSTHRPPSLRWWGICGSISRLGTCSSRVLVGACRTGCAARTAPAVAFWLTTTEASPGFCVIGLVGGNFAPRSVLARRGTARRSWRNRWRPACFTLIDRRTIYAQRRHRAGHRAGLGRDCFNAPHLPHLPRRRPSRTDYARRPISLTLWRRDE